MAGIRYDPSAMASVTFLGACGTVTGSATLLQWGRTRVLVDCGGVRRLLVLRRGTGVGPVAG